MRYHQLGCSGGGGAVPLVCCTTGGEYRGAGAFSVYDGGSECVVVASGALREENHRDQTLGVAAGWSDGGAELLVC